MEPVYYRPWGYYTTLLEAPNYKVKKIVVSTDKRLSLQYHLHRSEHWTITQGTCMVQIGDDFHDLKTNQSCYIPKGVKHRITNRGTEQVELIETQIGFCDENDIIRLEDDYGRV